jgi:cellulose synthase/poly-beta-1,6-N-acetylglucosamine synthase-like glycosyltransferase
MTLSTRVIKIFLRDLDKPYVPLPGGLRLQVLPNLGFLPGCQKHQFAAFIEDRGILVVWADNPRHLLERAAHIEKQLMQVTWDKSFTQADGKKEGVVQVDEVEADVEQSAGGSNRPLMMYMPVTSAFTLLLTFAALGGGWREVAFQTAVDGNYVRFAFILILIPQIWLALFFFQALVGDFAQVFGPVSQMAQNSKFYSGLPPKRLRRDAGPLPHVTIQLPVYKEGLDAVVAPTVESLKTAISTYEMQGGTANIFVNDDGMALIPAEDAQARRDFYDEHNIGWVARPEQTEEPDKNGREFFRRGKFKKASNMNYAMWISVRVEEKLAKIDRSMGWSQEYEAIAYNDALSEVIVEEEGHMQADGDIRMGDHILIIDSDTRVPADCFLDCVSEMEQCPQVAILQFSSGVMNVTDSFFEKGITFFTNMIYTQIRYAVASGDTAPFVGHNAILRWTALQEIAYDCKLDGREKYWSEETVSEDFDMSLRLQAAGYIVRLGAYFGDGFKEGVSLTVYDELSRWEKYAYGCSELLFHPFKDWPRHGPFTKLFRSFLFSSIAFPSKLTILAYIGTYYALGSSWFFTLMNYFLMGWLNGALDHYYLDSFKIYFAIIAVFYICGNVALAVLRYRTGEKGFLASFWENIRWIPLFTIFLGGVSLHVCQAIVSHMLYIEMMWGSTSKEAEDTNFFVEIPKILKNFKGTLTFCSLATAMMVVLARFVPVFWRIDTFVAIFPEAMVVTSHFLMPVALNPGLMKFSF